MRNEITYAVGLGCVGVVVIALAQAVGKGELSPLESHIRTGR